MEATETTLQLIKEAANKLKDSKLKRLNKHSTQSIMEEIVKGVGLKNIHQAILFVPMFENSCKCKDTNLDDIASYINCSTLDIAEYFPELSDMMKQGFIRLSDMDCIDMMRQSFIINEDIITSILEGKKVVPKDYIEEISLDKYDFCRIMSKKLENRDIPFLSKLKYVTAKEHIYKDIEFVKEASSLIPNIEDRMLFYNMCNNFINTNIKKHGATDVENTLMNIYEHANKRITCKKKLILGTHKLISEGFIRFRDNDQYELVLTDKGKKFFLAEDIISFSKSYLNLDRYSFVKAIYDYIESDEFDKELLFALYDLQQRVIEIEKSNPQLRFITKLSEIIPNVEDRITFYMICLKCVEGDDLDVARYHNALYPFKDSNVAMRQYKEEKNILQMTKLVEIKNESNFFDDRTYLKCTDKGLDLFFEEDVEFYRSEIDTKSLLRPTDIQEKHLFFTKELNDQISMVKGSLQEKSYLQLRKRLEDKSLAKGIAVLMYGLPGTGKTESVLQIAKSTGRNIMRVDISATKSMWFGESEKTIKKVFTDYKYICEKSTLTPILLFNEADAIFSKRKDVNSGNINQTENTIQNIILEEMEKLDGILIATTNLADNLDAAFERRFLFKIKFEKPTLKTKQNIWKDKIPFLADVEAEKLAKEFDFSGGEIDNIVRKAMMREVIVGEQPTPNILYEFCKEERITNSNYIKIGFI